MAPSAYTLPSGLVYEMVPAIASRRLIWPSILFAHVGEFESSKSAMNMLAPELSALITILRSTGPVISTRRSVRSAGIGATVHSAGAHALRFGQEIRQLAGIDRRLALDSAFEQFPPARAKIPFEFGDEGEGLRRKDLGEFRAHRSADRQFVGFDA